MEYVPEQLRWLILILLFVTYHLIHFSAKSAVLISGSSVRGIIYLYIFNPIDFNALLLISQRINVGHEN